LQKFARNEEIFDPSNFEDVFLGLVSQMVFKLHFSQSQMQHFALISQNCQKRFQRFYKRYFSTARQIFKCGGSDFLVCLQVILNP